MPIKALLLCIAAVAAMLPGPVRADGAYPDRTVEWVVPFGPGGGSDRWARIMSSAAIDAFGQAWHVRNRGGEEGRLGWRYMLGKPPDGYTILQGSMTPAVAALRDPASGFRPQDVKIAAFISSIKTHLIAMPDSGFDSWDRLTARPPTSARPRIGGTPAVLLAAATGLDRLGVSATLHTFSGTGEAVSALLSGEVDMAAVSTSTVFSLAGRASPVINIGARDNTPAIKEKIGDVPWIGALGAVGIGVPRWVGVHPDTPDEVVDRISEGVGKVLADKSVIKLMTKLGEEIHYLPRDAASAAYSELLERMKELLSRMP
ncbi:MAG: tripartite tricarboxylate transporter substrate-binding protein [Alphaproteobacteria bacterium]|nr:tripartite tricarboxylate transporter substrate-binding protein [Alphaproteobacteria bacterium]